MFQSRISVSCNCEHIAHFYSCSQSGERAIKFKGKWVRAVLSAVPPEIYLNAALDIKGLHLPL